jgi:hypothetical protein
MSEAMKRGNYVVAPYRYRDAMRVIEDTAELIEFYSNRAEVNTKKGYDYWAKSDRDMAKLLKAERNGQLTIMKELGLIEREENE